MKKQDMKKQSMRNAAESSSEKADTLFLWDFKNLLTFMYKLTRMAAVNAGIRFDQH